MDGSTHNLFPVIGPTEMRDYIAIGRAGTSGRLTRQRNYQQNGSTEGSYGYSIGSGTALPGSPVPPPVGRVGPPGKPSEA